MLDPPRQQKQPRRLVYGAWGFSKETSKAQPLQLQSSKDAFRHLNKIERKAVVVGMLHTAGVIFVSAA